MRDTNARHFFLVKAAKWVEKCWRMKRFLSAVVATMMVLAQGHALQLRLTDLGGPELSLLGDGGAEVARVAPGTVGQMIEAEDQKFVLSFGEDADGTWVAILSPASPEPKDFAVGVSAELPAILRSIEAGLVGGVTVNGRKVPSGMLWVASSALKDPVAVTAKDEATVTVRWAGPAMAAEHRQPLTVFEETTEEPGPPEFVAFAEPEPGIPTGQISPVADPEILTLPYEPVINPALLGPEMTPH